MVGLTKKEFIKKYGNTARKILKDWEKGKNLPTPLSKLLGKRKRK